MNNISPEAKQQAYLNLKESKYVDRMHTALQVFDILTTVQEEHVAMAAVSPHGLGKTTMFNHIVKKLPDADKIIINFEADATMRYFPWHYLYTLIKEGLEQYGYELEDQADFPEPESLNNYESYVQTLLSKLKLNLYRIAYKRPLYILINDADLFFSDDKSKTFHWSFLFDSSPLPDNLYVIVSTDREPDAKMACTKMHVSLDEPKEFFTGYLDKYDWKIDASLLEGANSKLQYSDYKFIADYLIQYCDASSYEQVARKLLGMSDFFEVFQYAFTSFTSGMSPQGVSTFIVILLRLYAFKPGLSETDLLKPFDITETDKEDVLRSLRYFTKEENGCISLSDPFVFYFIGKSVRFFFNVIGISSMDVLDPFCETLDKTIVAFAGELAGLEGTYEVDVPSERDFRMLAFVQEAANLYRINTRADLYGHILSNVDLMLFICARSHALYRRLIDGYYELIHHIQETQFSHVDMNNMRYTLNHVLEPIAKADKEKYSEFAVGNAIEQAIWVLEEHDMIDEDFGEISRLSEEEGAGALTLQDFAINACSEEAEERFYDIDYDSDEEDADILIEVADRVIGYYNEVSSIPDRLLYAAYILRMFVVLQELGKLPDEYANSIPTMVRDIKVYLNFCFYPEVHTLFETLFKAIQP